MCLSDCRQCVNDLLFADIARNIYCVQSQRVIPEGDDFQRKSMAERNF